MTTPYHPPVKRSVEIAGHKTSISLEPLFWEWLRAEAQAAALPINALVARIDAERIVAQHPPGLAGAIRLWLAARAVARLKDAGLNEPQQAGSAAVHPPMGTKPTSGR